MKIILIGGIAVYFLSRVLCSRIYGRTQCESSQQTVYTAFLFIVEMITLMVIGVQLFIFPWLWKPLIVLKPMGIIFFISGVILSTWGRLTLADNWHTARKFAKPERLVTNGIYAYIRHPIYGGSLLMGLGFELALSSMLFFIVLVFGTGCIVVLTYKEEKLLHAWFDEYKLYAQQTARFIPFIF